MASLPSPRARSATAGVGWEEVAVAVGLQGPQAAREEWGAGRCSDASRGSMAAARHVKVCLIIAGVFMAWLAGGHGGARRARRAGGTCPVRPEGEDGHSSRILSLCGR